MTLCQQSYMFHMHIFGRCYEFGYRRLEQNDKTVLGQWGAMHPELGGGGSSWQLSHFHVRQGNETAAQADCLNFKFSYVIKERLYEEALSMVIERDRAAEGL